MRKTYLMLYNYLLGSKNTIALRQANSVSSICTSVIGLTNSSMILHPTRLISRSGDIRESMKKLIHKCNKNK